MIYFYIFLASFLLSLLFTFLVKKLGFKYGLFDKPQGDELKIHKIPIPFTGGVAFFGVFVLFLFISWILKNKGILFFDTNTLLVVISGSILSFIYGLWDDLKWHRTDEKVAQMVKLLIQILLAIIVASLFILGKIYWQFIPIPILSFVVSAIYFLVIFNAINIQNGLDGLLEGIAIISLIGFLIISLILSNYLNTILVAILIGGIFGFLFFNWHPASIFMGNNGSQFLGFIMTFFAIYYTMKPYNLYWLLGPLFIIGMPLVNIVFVVSRRIIKKQSIFKADRHHIYDEILSKIPSVKKTVVVNYLIQIILVTIGVYLIIHQ